MAAAVYESLFDTYAAATTPGEIDRFILHLANALDHTPHKIPTTFDVWLSARLNTIEGWIDARPRCAIATVLRSLLVAFRASSRADAIQRSVTRA